MALAPTPGPVIIGPTPDVISAPDIIFVNVSEDAYNGNAQFTLSVDGVQIGGVLASSALHSERQQQTFIVNGNFGGGPHVLGVNFLNDAYGGTADTDRNLWLNSVQAGGVTYATETPLFNNGLKTFDINLPGGPVTIGTGRDVIGVHIAEDAYQGDAQFTIAVNGVQIGGVQTATTLHSSGQDQLFNVLGDFGIGPLSLTVNFLNDAYGGTSDTDRNLYVTRIERGGLSDRIDQGLFSSGPADIALRAISPPTGPVAFGDGPDSITLGISEDIYQDNARFTVSVDGVQVDGVQSATVQHGVGQPQSFTALGNFGAGPHVVAVSFLNDAYGGTAGTDRNLWVDSISYAGLTTSVETGLFSNGTVTFNVREPAEVITGSNITGPVGGGAVLNGTPGDDTIVARGTDNIVRGNGGNDTVTGSAAGRDTINVGTARDGLVSLTETVAISGPGNVVTAGDAAVSLLGSTSGTVAKLGNGANTVILDGPGNAVEVGVGANILAMTGGDATIRISAFVPQGTKYSDTITISGERNSVLARVNEGKYPAAGAVTIDGGTGFGTFDLGWGSGTVRTDGPGNTVSFGAGTFDVTPGSGSDTVTASGIPGTAIGTIHLAGLNNVVRGTGAQLAVSGGDGGGTFDFLYSTTTGGKASSLDTGGLGNNVTLRGSEATIRLNGGGDTVSIFGGKSSVVFNGSGDMLFLRPTDAVFGGPGATSVLDNSAGLQISLDPGFGSLSISGFDPTGVFQLKSGIGGFTTPDQAAAAVVYDRSGFNTLLLGSDRVVFTSVPLTASNFTIG